MRLHLWISGRVQGVNFREATRRQAERGGITGWVRNSPDGRVEALFDGAAEAVRALTDWCRHGPPDAHVESIVEREEDAGEPYVGFQVRR